MSWIEGLKVRFYGTTPTEHTGDLQVINKSTIQARWKCGHRFPTHFTLRVYGENLPLQEGYFTTMQLCGECFLEQVKQTYIRCGKCGKAILPGQPVTLYWGDKKRKFSHFKEGKRTPKGDPKTPEGGLIGCLRANCNPLFLEVGAAMLCQGIWDGKQFVPAFDQPGGAPAEALRTGRPVLVVIRQTTANL